MLVGAESEGARIGKAVDAIDAHYALFSNTDVLRTLIPKFTTIDQAQ